MESDCYTFYRERSGKAADKETFEPSPEKNERVSHGDTLEKKHSRYTGALAKVKRLGASIRCICSKDNRRPVLLDLTEY